MGNQRLTYCCRYLAVGRRNRAQGERERKQLFGREAPPHAKVLGIERERERERERESAPLRLLRILLLISRRIGRENSLALDMFSGVAHVLL
jgi:hypothetical protein